MLAEITQLEHPLVRILWFWVFTLRAVEREIFWDFTTVFWMEKTQILAVLVAFVSHEKSEDSFISKVTI